MDTQQQDVNIIASIYKNGYIKTKGGKSLFQVVLIKSVHGNNISEIKLRIENQQFKELLCQLSG